ncbi:hypothetical protein GOBAR_DD21972 [Gossypium barbadense]|nr:hypothetical protein GOBAR_DD21972 [Gossypium barbadense]
MTIWGLLGKWEFEGWWRRVIVRRLPIFSSPKPMCCVADSMAKVARRLSPGLHLFQQPPAWVECLFRQYMA